MSARRMLMAAGTAVLSLGVLAGCESMDGYASVGVGYYGGYYPGYYGPGYGYPGYWYDDDRPIVIVPPNDRPGKPTTLPSYGDRPSTLPATRPPSSARPSAPMPRPTPRPMPRPRGR